MTRCVLQRKPEEHDTKTLQLVSKGFRKQWWWWGRQTYGSESTGSVFGLWTAAIALEHEQTTRHIHQNALGYIRILHNCREIVTTQSNQTLTLSMMNKWHDRLDWVPLPWTTFPIALKQASIGFLLTHYEYQSDTEVMPEGNRSNTRNLMEEY